MLEIIETIRKIKETDASVLIFGEMGTGKEVVADYIQNTSGRRHYPYVKVNCAALPGELVESELFGYTKGAFTGAGANKKGMFELANRGTIFLDEIGDLSYSAQAKVLRVLQEKAFRRIGGIDILESDFRLISATNKDLGKEFREDLLYRINLISISIPPLRNRCEDIEGLVELFSERYSRQYEKPILKFSNPVLDGFISYHWPGNVRELQSTIHRLVLLSDSVEINPDNKYLKSINFRKINNVSVTKKLESVEKQTILKALEESDWSQKLAAEKLGIYQSNISRKIKKYGITRKSWRTNV